MQLCPDTADLRLEEVVSAMYSCTAVTPCHARKDMWLPPPLSATRLVPHPKGTQTWRIRIMWLEGEHGIAREMSGGRVWNRQRQQHKVRTVFSFWGAGAS